MNNLRKFRLAMNLSQEYIAKNLSVSQQAIAKWETGEALPRADKLPKLAKILNCTVDDLFKKKVK